MGARRTLDPCPLAAHERIYLKEMATPAARHLITLLAALSKTTNLAVGCYCADASHCHRSLLARLLDDAGATMAGQTETAAGE